MYKMQTTKKVEKHLKKMKNKQLFNTFKEELKKIKENPFIGETKKGDLTGIYSHEFKYDKTTYKIAYDIYEEEEKIIVLLTGTHENFYEQLKRYLK